MVYIVEIDYKKTGLDHKLADLGKLASLFFPYYYINMFYSRNM